MSETTINFLFLFAGLLAGGLIAWILTKNFLKLKYLSPKDVAEKYILREVHDVLQQQSDVFQENLNEKEVELREYSRQLASKTQSLSHLQEKLSAQEKYFETLREQSKIEFENIANKLFEEKTNLFSNKSQKQLNDILNPLKEKINEFERGIDRKFSEEAKDKISLKKEIEQLKELNQQLSSDANNLAKALKGDSKTQGDWGEFQLELLLNKAGLEKDIHYTVQPSFKDENGEDKRPDFVINLPDDKHLVIDSKVSLTAYDSFYNSEDEKSAKRYLKEHIKSIQNHIKNLSSKNYQNLYQITSPDYLLLFIPVEPAFSTAIQENKNLFLDALENNIVLVSTTTLLATMRTVSYIWKQEKQKKSVIEIARQSGLLYDKFVNFIEDLKSIGVKLESAQTSYNNAMNKLSDSKKFGDTLIGRAQKIKELGAKATKSLPKELIDDNA